MRNRLVRFIYILVVFVHFFLIAERLLSTTYDFGVIWPKGKKANDKRPLKIGHYQKGNTQKANTQEGQFNRKANAQEGQLNRKAKILHIFRNLTPTPPESTPMSLWPRPKNIYFPNLQNKYGHLTLTLQNPPQFSQCSFPLCYIVVVVGM